VARCGVCAHANTVALLADGQPLSFKTDFSPKAFARWLAIARNALRVGDPGICIGACERCLTAIVLNPTQRAELPCPHCRTVREGQVHELLTDQWFEPWVLVEGRATSVEYRLACVSDNEAGERPVCGTCGIVLGDDPRCRRCGTLAGITRDGATRFRVMVRASGNSGDQTFSALLPIAEAEVRLGREARAAGAVISSRSFTIAFAITGSIVLALVIMGAMLLAWCTR
jgi:hypothetical protein